MVGGTKVQTAIFIPGKVDDLSWVLWKRNLRQGFLFKRFTERMLSGEGDRGKWPRAGEKN